VERYSFGRSMRLRWSRRSVSVWLVGAVTGLVLATGVGTWARTPPVVQYIGGNYDSDLHYFGYQLIGTVSDPAEVGIKNVGTVPITISRISLQDFDAADFSIRSDSGEGVLAPGDSRRLTVVCRASAAGYRNANLLYYDDTAESPHLFRLQALGVTTTVLRTPASLDFGSQPIRTTTAERQLDIDTQTTSLHIQRVTVDGPQAADFSVRTDCLQMDPVLRCRIWVAFAPRWTGPRSATLTIWDDAPGSPHVVPLSGFGAPGPPAQPSGLSAQLGSLTQVNLHWTDNAGDETGFEVQRQLYGGTWSLIASLPTNSTGYADGGVTPLNTYLYRVRAVNAVGASPWTFEVAAQTVNRPAAPTGLTANLNSPRSITLGWQDNSGNERGFAIFRKGLEGVYSRVAVCAANATSYTDYGLLPGVAYSYQVRAANDEGVSSWSNEASATTPDAPPAAPTNLAGTSFAPFDVYVTLTWTDNSHNETQFAVWRKEGAIDWRRVAIVFPNETQFTEGGLLPGVTYYYRVRATNNMGASAWSNVISVTTPSPP
jgi:fibronectin type III domain protein